MTSTTVRFQCAMVPVALPAFVRDAARRLCAMRVPITAAGAQACSSTIHSQLTNCSSRADVAAA